MLLQGHSRPLHGCAVAPFGGQYPIIFTGSEDEMVKAWDIRNAKACLFELSTGAMQVADLAWNESRNTLFVAGKASLG